MPWCRSPGRDYCAPHRREKMEQERRVEPGRTFLLLLMKEGKALVEVAYSRAGVDGATRSAEVAAVCEWVEDEIQ